MKKKITGDWSGEPIWREETAEERLLKAISEATSFFKKYNGDNFFKKYNGNNKKSGYCYNQDGYCENDNCRCK